MKHQPTPEQKEAAAKRREAFKQMVKTIAAYTPEQRAAFMSRRLVTNPEGHTLSPTNQMLLALQMHSPSIVAGFAQWKKLGRTVRKGEHGAMIWCPIGPKNEEGKIEGTDDDVNFIPVTVFDITQTDEIQH